MKSYRSISLIFFIICTSIACAQEADLSVLDSIRVPTSPAFKIIGTEPSSVERPTDLKALAVDLGDLITSGEALPSEFAMEFGLAKLFSSRKKALFDYYYPNIASSMTDNLSISLANADIPPDMFVDTNYHSSASWSFGLRTHILSGGYALNRSELIQYLRDSISMKDNVDRLLNLTLETILRDTLWFAEFKSNPSSSSLFEKAFGRALYSTPGILQVVNTYDVTALKKATQLFFTKFAEENAAMIPGLTPPGFKAFLDSYKDWSTVNILNAPTAIYSAQRLANILALKSGHFLEIAAAGAGVGRNNKFDEFSLKRYGIWLTYSYRPASSENWEGAGMLRLLSNQVDSNTKAMSMDVGVRASSPREWAAAISLEAVTRFSPDYKPDYRIAVVGDYPLTENFYLTATFGRGFDLGQLTQGEFLSVLGFKFGLGANKLVLPTSEPN